MSEPENDLVPSVPPHLKTFQATNGSRVRLSLISGEILDHRTRNIKKRRGKRLVEKIEHQISLFLSDGREECLRVSNLKGAIEPGQSLTLVIGSNPERDECVAIYNRSTAQVFYRKEVWGKLLSVGCFLPVLFILFIFPLIWLTIFAIASKLSFDNKLAIFVSPVLATGVTLFLYLVAIIPVRQLFRQRINAILAIGEKT